MPPRGGKCLKIPALSLKWPVLPRAITRWCTISSLMISLSDFQKLLIKEKLHLPKGNNNPARKEKVFKEHNRRSLIISLANSYLLRKSCEVN